MTVWRTMKPRITKVRGGWECKKPWTPGVTGLGLTPEEAYYNWVLAEQNIFLARGALWNVKKPP